jgi:hypothetical protein
VRRSRPRAVTTPQESALAAAPAAEPTAVIDDDEPLFATPAKPAEAETEEPAKQQVDASAEPAAEEKKPARRTRRTTKKTETAAPETASTEATQPIIEIPDEPGQEPSADTRSRSRRGRRTRAERGAASAVDQNVPTGPQVPPRGAYVVMHNGRPSLYIAGKRTVPMLFFGSMEDEKQARRTESQIQRAAKAGVHLHSTLIELICPIPPDDSVYEQVDQRLQAILKADSQAYLLPRFVFVPGDQWLTQYPNEMTVTTDGVGHDPSIASERFWFDAETALRLVIEHIRKSSYGERVVGYHLEKGEWFHPVDGGYDRSYANREGWRDWLRAKYHNSEVALRAAWFDSAAHFYTAEIPPMATGERREIAFFEPRKERRWIDFLEYTSDITATRLLSLAKAVKEATDGTCLVSMCYGYTWEFGHTFSGHLALQRILESPHVDLLCGPPTYRDRRPGGSGFFPSPVDSAALHGKYWFSEDDTKTHLANSGDLDDFNPRVDSAQGTETVHHRAMGLSLVHQTGIGWMDLWGEGWLDAQDIWNRIESFNLRYARQADRAATSPEVVVMVDERSLVHLQKNGGFVRRLLADQRDMLLRSGASIGFYLQSDVTAETFPTDARLYLFINPYRITAEQRAAVQDKLLSGGKTLVWMYAAGVCDDNGIPEESANDLIGMTVRQQSWNSEVGSRVIDTRHPITSDMRDKLVGPKERLNPSYFVDEPDGQVQVLAEYVGTGLPSIAVRETSAFRSVFVGEPTLTPDLLRGLLKAAKCHAFTRGGDEYVFARNGWLVVSALRDGTRTVTPPAGCALYDVTEGRLLSEDGTEARVYMRGRSTRLFFYGKLEEMQALGLPGADPGKVRPSEPAPEETPQPSEPETVTHPTAAAAGAEQAEPEVIWPEDDEPLGGAEAEDGAEETDGDESGEDADTSADPDAVRRRRRRRGGRGRGRRRPAAGGAAAGGGTE